MNAAQQAKKAMENKLSSIAGHDVEITIRGDRSFTFYFDAIDPEAAKKLAATAQGEKIEIDEDPELGTCVYIN